MDAAAFSSSLKYASDSATAGAGSAARPADQRNATLGRWFFDKLKRKRKYVDLTGQTLSGWKAQVQAQVDKSNAKHPDRSGRLELEYTVGRAATAIDTENPEQLQAMRQIEMWGVPPRTRSKYAAAGVRELFEWQVRCLAADGCAALRGGSLVYSAPTSGGKTLVAEILMLRRLAMHPQKTNGSSSGGGTTIFFVVPFVSLAEEKAELFRSLWADIGVGVRVYHGDDGSATPLTPDVQVAVCTIERANIMLNRLLDEGRGAQLSMVVVDEVHMLSDRQRGFLLEVLLSKVKYLLGARVQVVAMSATLPNLSDLAGWLGASLYTTDHRPVDLTVLLCHKRVLYNMTADSGGLGLGETRRRGVAPVKTPNGDDPDGWMGLCAETASSQRSVLLFCPSRERCEQCATKLASLFRGLRSLAPSSMEALAASIAARMAVMSALQACAVGLCEVLAVTVPLGIAYHHAGLTTEEKAILEGAFRSGALSVLVATSTLAAGVNLPAHRVVIREPTMGGRPLTVTAFRQMCGRAGRMGLDTEGEAVVVCGSDAHRSLARQLLTGDIDPLLSSLHLGTGGGLEKLLLELVACRKLNSEQQAFDFVKSTLLAFQHPPNMVQQYVGAALQALRRGRFVMESTDGSLAASQLGVATMLSGIHPADALLILQPLVEANKRLVLQGGLHLVFLITPPSTHIVPKWSSYHNVLMRLARDCPCLEAVCEAVGIDTTMLLHMESGRRPPPAFGANDAKTLLHKRFFGAIVLYKLVQEYPMAELETLLDVKRGQLQQLQKEAAVFCSMTTTFCRKLNWETLALCLESLSCRVGFGVREELVALMRMGPVMNASRARSFFGCGLRSPEDIAAVELDVLEQVLLDGMPFEAQAPLAVGRSEHDLTRARHQQLCRRLAKQIKDRAEVLAARAVE